VPGAKLLRHRRRPARAGCRRKRESRSRAFLAVFGGDGGGQFAIVYQSKALPPRAWNPYVEANKGKVADWSWPWACGGCTAPKYTTF